MIYRIEFVEGGTYLLSDMPIFDMISYFDGTLADGLEKIDAELLEKNYYGRERIATDNIYFDTLVLTTTQRGRDILGKLIEPYGEWIDIYCDDKKYYAFNVTNEIDCFDEELSTCSYSPRTGNRVCVDNYHLVGDGLLNAVIFKLAGVRCSPIFVTEEFKHLVKSSELTGFIFEKQDYSEKGKS